MISRSVTPSLWPGWLGLLTAVIANTILTATGALTAIAYLYFAPIFSALVCLAYLAAGVKAHIQRHRLACKIPPTQEPPL